MESPHWPPRGIDAVDPSPRCALERGELERTGGARSPNTDPSPLASAAASRSTLPLLVHLSNPRGARLGMIAHVGVGRWPAACMRRPPRSRRSKGRVTPGNRPILKSHTRRGPTTKIPPSLQRGIDAGGTRHSGGRCSGGAAEELQPPLHQGGTTGTGRWWEGGH
jgi:hypothetical protein